MKIEIFTEGIGKVIASGYAMRNCISFLKFVYPRRCRWIKRNGIDFDMVYAVNYILRDQWIAENHCSNCADQASIAAPGQTVLCKTHSDEKHYREMNEFFDSQLSNLKFSVHMPLCSACGNDEAYYIGYIQGEIAITHYSFCKDCRSKLVLKQNAARAAQERIGA